MKYLKKLSFVIAATVALTAMFLTSCSNDMEPDVIKNEGMVDVVLTTSLPTEISTYATQSTNSLEGGIKNLTDKEGFYVRYIMEAYPQSSNERVLRMIQYKELKDVNDVCNNITFEARMLAAKYRFVFYADIVRDVNLGTGNSDLDAECRGNQYFLSNVDETSTALYRPTTDDGLQIGDLQTIIPANNANSVYGHTSIEQYDVYTCTGELDLRNETSKNFTLKRPFAKLRIITTDADSELLSDVKWSQTIVSLAGENLNNSFNALTEETTLNGRTYYTTAYKTRTREIDSYGEDKNGEKTLCVFYIPVSDSKSCNLNFTVTATSGSTTIADAVPYQVDNVPLVKNKVTTIKGNLLTKKVINTINIEDPFDGNATDDIILGQEASTIDELTSSLKPQNQIITYTGKITKADGLSIDFDELESEEISTYAVSNPLYTEDNDVELTLNFVSIEDGAVLTFKGKNAPKMVRIKTGTKCSLRIDMVNSEVVCVGDSYKYIVSNVPKITNDSKAPQYEAFFYAGNGGNFLCTEFTNSHLINIGEYFMPLDDSKCTYAKKHNGKVCTFIDEVLTPWLNNNSGKTVWDYVEANK